MHKLRSLSQALVAKAFCKFCARQNCTKGRPSAPLGARILTNPQDIFKHNMWDHVQWTDEEKENARQKVDENSHVQIPLQEQGQFDTEACKFWDNFYEVHQDKFFKDRKWLFQEFPELLPLEPKNIAVDCCQGVKQASCPQHSGSARVTESGLHEPYSPTNQITNYDVTKCQASCKGKMVANGESATHATPFPGHHAAFRILEVGCGVGNSVFPILKSIKDTAAFLYCCDFSSHAIQLVKDHPDYDYSLCHAFVHDICKEMASFPFPPQSLDVILAVFVLSSIHPERIQGVVNRLSSYLKHGGIFLFRDYGRHDFSQLRFKKGRCLSENFYTRGDGTCVYFFTKDEVHSLFSNAGLVEVQNLEDRRLQVNRKKKVVMHRVWMQSKYKKLLLPP